MSMDDFYRSLPFIASISLLVIGVLRLRRFLFVASFPILLLACFLDLVSDGSSGAFNFMGAFVLIFGLVCIALSGRIRPGSFLSGGGLRLIGALLFVLGFAGTMIA
jgi:hypothetical protein